MKNIFTQHPRCMNETYLEHFRCSFTFGVTMLVGGMACLVHAVFPFLFQKTGSNFLLKMMHNYVDRMPCAEERVTVLSEKMEKRFCNGKS